MTTFNLPDLGEGLAEAEIVSWHVNVGDRVKLDQPMLSVETAKAVVEVPSPYSGTIKALHANAGDIVPTGSALVEFDLEDAAGAQAKSGGSATATASKAVAAAFSPETQSAPSAKSADSGTVVGNMPTSDDELIEHVTAGGSRSSSQERVRAAPAVRALAKRLGIDLAALRGSGRGGLITVDDVMNVKGSAAAAVPAPRATGVAGVPPAAGTRPVAAIPARPAVTGGDEQLRGLRRGMAHSMAASRDSVANCTLFDDADLHSWIRKTDYTVRVMRAIAAAAQIEPGLNAHYDGEKMTRRLHQRVDIAIAVDTPEGLIVPAIRDVANKDSAQLRAELKGLKEASRTRSVAPEALRDFTFMLSNFGMLAGRYATPLVVPPAVAILGSGKLQHDVVAVLGGIEAHLRMPLSLTFDHRCITGGEAARFLAAVIADLERPE